MSSTDALRDALRKRYAPPAWALFEEVRNATGFERNLRVADAVAMGCWPSQGLELHGLELKTARADWLRELKDPRKADAIFRYMDRWWIVTVPDVVAPGELPVNWGLMTLGAGRLRVTVAAPKLEPAPIDRSFLASLLRNGIDADKRKLSALVEKEAEKRAAARCEALRLSLDHLYEQKNDLERRFKVFLDAAGLGHMAYDVLRWDRGEEIGRAVRLVLSGDQTVERLRGEIEGLRDRAARVLGAIEDALKEEAPVK